MQRGWEGSSGGEEEEREDELAGEWEEVSGFEWEGRNGDGFRCRWLLGASTNAGKTSKRRVFAKPPRNARLKGSSSDTDGEKERLHEAKASRENGDEANQTVFQTSWVQSAADGDEMWIPETRTAFKALISLRLCSAFWSNIADCDETFNYWEPVGCRRRVWNLFELFSVFPDSFPNLRRWNADMGIFPAIRHTFVRIFIIAGCVWQDLFEFFGE